MHAGSQRQLHAGSGAVMSPYRVAKQRPGVAP